MDKEEYLTIQKEQLIKTCDLILKEKINYVEGCNTLLKLAHSINLEFNETWNIIRSIDDDFLDTPIGESRKNFPKEFLDKADKEVKEFYPRIKELLFEACKNIIHSLKT